MPICVAHSGTLLWAQKTLPLTLLIDSGADDSFNDANLVQQVGLLLESLPQAKTVLDLDGRMLAKVTLLVSGNHREQIHLIPSSSAPAILGSPWLARHNPQTDWSTGSATRWSVGWHSRYRHSALPNAPSVVDLSTIPEVYHDISGVFSKQRASTLPSQCPYDCSIDLLPGTVLPSSWLYSLSRPEQEAMERYLSESLAAGLIHPSSSLVGAGSKRTTVLCHPALTTGA